MHARLDAGRVQILTRRGNDWTDKYPAIAKAIAGLPAQNAYLDDELCGVSPDGRTIEEQLAGIAHLVAFGGDLRIVGEIPDLPRGWQASSRYTKLAQLVACSVDAER